MEEIGEEECALQQSVPWRELKAVAAASANGGEGSNSHQEEVYVEHERDEGWLLGLSAFFPFLKFTRKKKFLPSKAFFIS